MTAGMSVHGRDRGREPRTLPIFDEKQHPLTVGHMTAHLCIISQSRLSPQRDEVPPHYGDYTPDHKIVYKFIKTLFHAAQVGMFNP